MHPVLPAAAVVAAAAALALALGGPVAQAAGSHPGAVVQQNVPGATAAAADVAAPPPAGPAADAAGVARSTARAAALERLSLIGTVASRAPEQALAVIAVDGGMGRPYRIGEPLADSGARLSAVESRHALLRFADGAVERLPLQAARAAAADASGDPAAVEPTTRDEAERSPSPAAARASAPERTATAATGERDASPAQATAVAPYQRPAGGVAYSVVATVTSGSTEPAATPDAGDAPAADDGAGTVVAADDPAAGPPVTFMPPPVPEPAPEAPQVEEPPPAVVPGPPRE